MPGGGRPEGEDKGQQKWVLSCLSHHLEVLQRDLGWGSSWLPGPDAEQEIDGHIFCVGTPDSVEEPDFPQGWVGKHEH